MFVNPGEQISFSLLATTEAPAIELPLSATDRRWSVNRPDLASIDENGTFTAIADGEVSVGVRVGGLVGEYTVTIAEGTLTGIDINPERADPLERCLPQTYFATGTFTDTSPAGESARGLLNIDWSTPDPEMGSVSNQLDGTASVTAFNAGMLVLNAEADSASGTANIAVEDNLQSMLFRQPR